MPERKRMPNSMNLGQRIIEGITDGVILRGVCACGETHGVVLVFSANADEQIEAIVQNDSDTLKRVMSSDAATIKELQQHLDDIQEAIPYPRHPLANTDIAGAVSAEISDKAKLRDQLSERTNRIAELEEYRDLEREIADLRHQIIGVQDENRRLVEKCEYPRLEDVKADNAITAANQRIEALVKALKDTAIIIEAHEIDTLDCNRSGVVHCDCLERQLKRNEALAHAAEVGKEQKA